jgi:ATP-dependent protease ClpP protease subunit
MPLPTQRPLWARRSEPSRPTSDPFWRIDNKAGDNGPAEIYLYDEISFWGVSAQSFATELGTVTAKDVTVRVNSPGGDVFDGIAIGNLLASHPATVTVQVDALAASIASVIAVMGADRLVMGPHSQMMIHDASGFAIGNATDMREAATMLDMVSDNIAEVYAVKAGGTPAAWRKTMKAETWYTAQEAVDAGLADEVRALPERDAADAEKVAARFDLAAYANRPAVLFAQAVDEVVDDEPEPETDEPDEVVEPDLEPEADEPDEDAEPDLDEDAVTSLSAAFMAALNKPIIFDPGTIRAAITMGAVDCPAPTIPVPDEPVTDTEPLLALSLGSTIKRATREARF